MNVALPPSLPEGAAGSRVARLGQRALLLCHDVGAIALVAAVGATTALRWRADPQETVRHLYRFAALPLPLLLGASVIVGGVVALQGLGYIDRYNATEVFGWAAGLSAFREVGPLLLGLVLCSRVGSKNTAELQAMRAKEQLTALTALGLDVTRVVIVPRVLAIALSALFVFPLAGTTILLTGFILASLVGGQLFFVSVHSVATYLDPAQILEGLFRLFAFTSAIALCSTAFGLGPVNSARDIGRAVQRSQVASMCAVVVLNLYLSFVAQTA